MEESNLGIGEATGKGRWKGHRKDTGIPLFPLHAPRKRDASSSETRGQQTSRGQNQEQR